MQNQILGIADISRKDKYFRCDEKTGELITSVNYNNIKRSQLRIKARQWLAAHLLPRKYGNKNQLTRAVDKPLPHASTTLIVNFVGNENEENI
ncbi:MAG: terminase small subunit-like protein [Smithellaceae bacterium]